MEAVFILVLAISIDLLVGEYPHIVHPTVWAGKLIGFMEKMTWGIKSPLQLIYGVVTSVLIISVFALSSWAILTWVKGINQWLFVLTAGLLLKASFCLRKQAEVASKTERVLLGREPVPAEMRPLFDTVNRKEVPTHQEIISSSVRSLTENTSDFVVAPLFYYLVLGVPGAIAYRVVNTLDSMIGHHGKYEYLGKFAARIDDAANYIPARLTGALYCMASSMSDGGGGDAWGTMWHDHGMTPSPNAGWPMAAAAGALQVNLFKSGSYSLGTPYKALEPATIRYSVRLYWDSMLIFGLAIFALLVFLKPGLT